MSTRNIRLIFDNQGVRLNLVGKNAAHDDLAHQAHGEGCGPYRIAHTVGAHQNAVLHACARDRLHDERQALLHERGGEKFSHRGFLPQDAHHDVLSGGYCGESLGII